MKKLTFNDIKNLSGLSLGTISRYFNNGSISNKSKEILDKIVSENNFILNTSAQNLKSKPKDIYVLIPATKSHSNYEITNGIIQNYNDVILVTYNNDFENFKQKFLWSLGTNHVGIIVFPPFNENIKVQNLIQNFKNSNIIIYDLTIPNFSSVKYNLQLPLKKIQKQNQKITLDYVFTNSKDHNFQNRCELFNNEFTSFKKQNIENFKPNNKNLTLFQYNDLLDHYPKYKWTNLIIISKEYNWKIKPKYWIKIDFEEIGFNLLKLTLQEKKEQIEIKSDLFLNYNLK